MTDETEDFATLFEASTRSRRIARGQTVEGPVVAIGNEVAFVDVGGKGEATIALDELRDADGALEVKVGDRIQAVVTATDDGVILSRRLARGAASARLLEQAAHSGLPVQGKVEGVVKGGFEVRIGGARAFCPASQIDIVRTDPEAHVGRVYEFRIVEYKEGGRNLVVSRRALLEEQQRAGAEEVRKEIAPGAVVTGRVVSVRDFGAFVDLGSGVQGLLHVSEIGWSRVTDAANLVKAGDEVTVKVLRVEPDTQRIALGLKQLTPDPWGTLADKYAVGQVVLGRVTRLEQFGAFVELEPGVEALAHVSTFPAGRPGAWKQLVPVNMAGAFEIRSIDLEKKRIGVALPAQRSNSAGPSDAQQEADDVRDYANRAGEQQGSGGVGSLADKLRQALEQKPRR